MQCPIDGATLQMTERQGIEIDYCPTCRGVWLDRGELDKMIAGSAPSQPDHRESRDNHHERSRQYSDHHDRDYDDHHKKKPKKREGFMGDLFDF